MHLYTRREMAKLALIYGLRLLPEEDLAEVREAIVVLTLAPPLEAVSTLIYMGAALVTTSALLVRSAERQAALVAVLEQRAATDSLTGLVTRRVFDDAIAAAGGPTAKAQLDSVNLAAPVADGEQVIVPGRGAGGVVAASTPAAGSSPSAPLDLNSATLEQLENLPGVGPVTAQKILDYRQAHGAFHAVAELEGVPGIGPAHMAQLKGLVIP